ncbi:MAG: Gfo/Idh/MocA family oxidoreductase [Acidobacteriota bacterium]|nr:Gfo/Idh/MocA family oxidoreductase [Acidobacteriota bacterium]
MSAAVERRPVGFGLIGTGMAGGFSARELAFVEGGFLAAVCSRDPERLRAFAAGYGNPRAHTDYRELIADPEVEVVIVTSPTGLHAEMTLAAADAGRHVLVEKPLEATVEAGERMVEHCRARGVRLGVIFQMRFGRVADMLRELLSSGGLGEIWLADAFDKASRSPSYYRRAAWRGTAALEGGGCLMTQSIHIIDLLQHLVGPVASVIGRTATRRHAIEVEDVATAMLRFDNGAMGVVESTTAIRPALRSRLEIHGERGTVIANAQYDHFLVWDVEGVPGPEGLPETPDWVDTDDPWAYPQTRHRVQLQDMADAVREGRDPVLTGEEALRSLRVVKAIQESSALGREVFLKT